MVIMNAPVVVGVTAPGPVEDVKAVIVAAIPSRRYVLGRSASIASKINLTWWRHQMETISALLALCEGNPPVTGGFTAMKKRNFGVIVLLMAWCRRHGGD